jgi:hypothetical protein
MLDCAYLAYVRNMLAARGTKISIISISGAIEFGCNLLQNDFCFSEWYLRQIYFIKGLLSRNTMHCEYILSLKEAP